MNHPNMSYKAEQSMMVMAALALSMGMAVGQEQNPSLPRTPTAFETRNTGGTAEPEVSITEEKSKAKKITYTAVTELREWKDTGGKVIRAYLLAFEAVNGEDALLVKDGNIRFLVDGAKQSSPLPLERLCIEDRIYIGKLVAARKPQAGSQKAP